MRLGIAIVACATACSYNPPPVGGDDDDTPGEDTVTIVDDSETDFMASGDHVDLKITPQGTLEPEAFVIGGLRARSFANRLINAGDNFNVLYAQILTATALGKGYAQIPDNWGNARPRGLSLVGDDNWTVLYEGEIELAAGTRVIGLDADDLGILEIDAGGTTYFVADATSGRKTINVDVPNTGWYPIRVAIGESSGNARLSVVVDDVFDREKLRARVTAEEGLTAHVYQLGYETLLGTAAADSFDGSFGQIAPQFDLPAPALGNYDLRSVGQLFVDVAGTWQFELQCSAEDHARLFVDEVHVASKLAGGIDDGLPSIVSLDLEVGWHDIFVDLRVAQTNPVTATVTRHDASIALLAAKPGGAMQGIKASALRPVVSSGLASGVFRMGSVSLQDGATVSVQLPVPAGATRIHTLDAGYVMSTDPTNYTIELVAGDHVLAIPQLAVPGFGWLHDDVTLRGEPLPSAPWSMRFTDDMVGDGPGEIRVVYADMVTRGGPRPPFAPVISYTSKPHATPDAIRLGAVRVRGVLYEAVLALAVRTAASEAELASAAWVEVAPDGVPDAPSGAFIQYKVTATSDGWHFPVIDAVELDYVVPE